MSSSFLEGGRNLRHVLCVVGGGAENKFMSREFTSPGH